MSSDSGFSKTQRSCTCRPRPCTITASEGKLQGILIIRFSSRLTQPSHGVLVINVEHSSYIKSMILNGCGSQCSARWDITPSQCPALPIRPALRSTRSPHQPALTAGAKRKVESGCEVRHAPAITGFTWLVHGSHGCSTFCVGAGWRAGSYTRERQHAKRTFFHSHNAGGSQIALERARAGYIPRRCTCGIDLRCRFSLTSQITQKCCANNVVIASLYTFGLQCLHVWHRSRQEPLEK